MHDYKKEGAYLLTDNTKELKRIFSYFLSARRNVISVIDSLTTEQLSIIAGELMQEIDEHDPRYENMVEVVELYSTKEIDPDDSNNIAFRIEDEQAKEFLKQLLSVYFGIDIGSELL